MEKLSLAFELLLVHPIVSVKEIIWGKSIKNKKMNKSVFNVNFKAVINLQ